MILILIFTCWFIKMTINRYRTRRAAIRTVAVRQKQTIKEKLNNAHHEYLFRPTKVISAPAFLTKVLMNF